LGQLWEIARPPWTGSLVVVSGMTWARAAIFFGSDKGSMYLHQAGWNTATATTMPPLIISALVQLANQPFIRSSVMLQGDPRVTFASKAALPNLAVLHHLRRTHGTGSWFLGTSVGILKTVPKYVVAFCIKEKMERWLAPVDENSLHADRLWRSIKKSVTAGVVGAALTNPFDVMQNEMFKAEEKSLQCLGRLWRQEGPGWLFRGLERNIASSAVPIAATIFFTDMFTSLQTKGSNATDVFE